MDENTKDDIRKAVLAIVNSIIPVVCEWCTVKSVDWGEKTCEVILDEDEDLVLPKIKLGFDKSGCVIKPTVNKSVLVLFVSGLQNVGVVVMAEQTDDMELFGNEFGAIPVAGNIKDKLNALEQAINQLKATLAAIVAAAALPTTPVTTGMLAGFFNTGGFLPAPLLTLTTTPNLEGKVKHGQG